YGIDPVPGGGAMTADPVDGRGRWVDHRRARDSSGVDVSARQIRTRDRGPQMSLPYDLPVCVGQREDGVVLGGSDENASSKERLGIDFPVERGRDPPR